MSTSPKVISLEKFNMIKRELKGGGECPGELHVWTGTPPDHGYVVLIESNHHGCMMIDGTSIVAVNDGIRLM